MNLTNEELQIINENLFEGDELYTLHFVYYYKFCLILKKYVSQFVLYKNSLFLKYSFDHFRKFPVRLKWTPFGRVQARNQKFFMVSKVSRN